MEIKYVPRVYVWIPSGSGRPFPEVLISVYSQTAFKEGIAELYFFPDNIVAWKPIQHARNEILYNFIKSNCDYLWFVDDDNPPNYDVLEKLLKPEVDFISALVPIRHWDWYLLNVFREGKHLTSYAGMPNLIEIDNCWTGCVLISRELVQEMFNAFGWHPYQFRYEIFWLDLDTDKPKVYNELDTTTNWKLENDKPKLRTEYISEDLFFWREAKARWYVIYADVTAHCKHYQSPKYLTVKYEETIENNLDCYTNPTSEEWGGEDLFEFTITTTWLHSLWEDSNWEQTS